MVATWVDLWQRPFKVESESPGSQTQIEFNFEGARRHVNPGYRPGSHKDRVMRCGLRLVNFDEAWLPERVDSCISSVCLCLFALAVPLNHRPLTHPQDLTSKLMA